MCVIKPSKKVFSFSVKIHKKSLGGWAGCPDPPGSCLQHFPDPLAGFGGGEGKGGEGEKRGGVISESRRQCRNIYCRIAPSLTGLLAEMTIRQWRALYDDECRATVPSLMHLVNVLIVNNRRRLTVCDRGASRGNVVHTSNNVEATLSNTTSRTILSTKSTQIEHVQFRSTLLLVWTGLYVAFSLRP